MDVPGPIIDRFAPITLAEMDRVALLDRTDTKYVLPAAMLPGVLHELLPEYRLLEVDGVRGTAYRSLYLDTADLRHYHDHHNRRTFRNKVRYREYLGSGLAYLEVKRKTGRGGTDKVRKRITAIPERPDAAQLAFIQKATGRTDELRPVLWNTFTRYTLVHRVRAERLTIDVGLRFAWDDQERALGPVVVAELKERRADRGSPFAMAMRARGIRPAGMSKYCVGMLLM
ncbi:MAG: polyphosphate polymerase domain-containing protein, partial [Flavobacteriales bacterium]|nr:polyphosphate polymerase domain-containing protein [Flavobacteriales bacterium]